MFKLTKLKRELQFNKETGEMINVLKGVASSEFYRLQKERRKLDEFADYLKDFFQMIDITGFHHPFVEESQLPGAIIFITSDAGFLGKLNISVVRAGLEQYSGNERLIVVGHQGIRYLTGETEGKYIEFPGISDDVKYEEAQNLGDYIFKGFLNKEFGRTSVIYPHFVSFTVWRVQVYQLLPCRFLFPEPGPESVQALRRHELESEEERLVIEPSLDRIIEYLVKIRLNYIFYNIFWESKLSEWSARVMHLEGSHSKITEMHKDLHLQYFRALHAISDKNIREIYAGGLELKKAFGQ